MKHWLFLVSKIHKNTTMTQYTEPTRDELWNSIQIVEEALKHSPNFDERATYLFQKYAERVLEVAE